MTWFSVQLVRLITTPLWIYFRWFHRNSSDTKEETDGKALRRPSNLKTALRHFSDRLITKVVTSKKKGKKEEEEEDDKPSPEFRNNGHHVTLWDPSQFVS